MLFVARRSAFVVAILLVVLCLVFGVWCLSCVLLVVLVFGARGLMFVICCVLFVVC